jgi:alpha-L-fucosidase 2
MNPSIYRSIAVLAVSGCFCMAAAPASTSNTPANLKLWYSQPAKVWMTEALPIGNGRIGAMFFGGVEKERIQFNEESLWTGKPFAATHVNDPKLADEALELMRKGDIAGFNKVGGQIAATSRKGPGYVDPRKYFGGYQSFGDVTLEMKHPAGEATDYRRQLDLSDATGDVRYTVGGVTYRREYFASFPDQALVVRLTADKPGQIGFRVNLTTKHKKAATRAENGQLILSGSIAGNDLGFEAQLAVRAKDGQVSEAGQTLEVTGADEVELILTAATSYRSATADAYGQHTGEKPDLVCSRQLQAALKKPFAELRRAHVSDYQVLNNRCVLDLKGARDLSGTPTDERLQLAQTTPDPELEALVFQYGRYLLISSSRPGTMPGNLQGIWNESNTPAWDCDWHTDINVEMNYWPAEVTGLPECHLPLFDLMKTLQDSGEGVAKRAFNARGWFAPIYTNPWGYNDNRWNWRGAAGWLCQHAWEHYLYTGDQKFLNETGYPLMKGAALCMFDGLVELDGKLVTGIAESPENIYPGGRYDFGVACDMQIASELFANCIQAAKILDTDKDFSKQLADARARLTPPKVGRYGQLQEWNRDIDREKDGHRHTSHLWAVFPGSEITPQATPKLAAAAEVSLVGRGKATNGWAFPWRSLIYSRLRKSDQAYEWLKAGLGYTRTTAMVYNRGGGMYPNLLGACPPFQIDSNFGSTAAIAEMLLQSHRLDTSGTPIIELLPALPKAWPNGKVTGLRARGGTVIDIEWKDGKVTDYHLTSKHPKPVTLVVDGESKNVTPKAF